MTLYLKYRPQTIDELDLESVRDDLKKILASDSIPHAFLFSGPKGVGKTSAARILAKIINCNKKTKDNEPCNVCDMCISIMKGNNIDIMELDAASNRGIDDIRSLRQSLYLAPARANKKVYIIDEAHMLTLEAANAFLKTLEEPPPHVVFILATTNPEKLPATVLSRLTQINFTKAKVKDIDRQLTRVAKGEKVKITPDAIEKIAKLADGSFRDAVKILESLITKTKDIKLVDITSFDYSEFFTLIKTADIKANLEFIEKLVSMGVVIKSFIDDVIEEIHLSILAKNGINKDNLPEIKLDELIKLGEALSDARKNLDGPVPQLALEIALLEFCKKPSVSDVNEVKEATPKKKEVISKLDNEVWLKLLTDLRGKNFNIEALLRAAKPISFDGRELCLGIYYQFHKERLETNSNKLILEEVVKSTFGIDYVKINFELIDKPKVASLEPTIAVSNVEPLTPKVDKDILDAAKEIFG